MGRLSACPTRPPRARPLGALARPRAPKRHRWRRFCTLFNANPPHEAACCAQAGAPSRGPTTGAPTRPAKSSARTLAGGAARGLPLHPCGRRERPMMGAARTSKTSLRWLGGGEGVAHRARRRGSRTLTRGGAGLGRAGLGRALRSALAPAAHGACLLGWGWRWGGGSLRFDHRHLAASRRFRVDVATMVSE